MPAHDRLCGRLNGLVTQAAQLSRQHHEPLLFLYPRWFATSVQQQQQPRTSTTQAPAEDRDGSLLPNKHEVNPISQSPRQAEVSDADASELDSRPSSKLVKRIMSKTEHEKKKAKRRQEVHKKYPDADDWRIAFNTLRKHTPSGSNHYVKQLERLKMPKGMMGYYTADLDHLFLDIYLTTDCHVQIERYYEDGKGRFKSLTLVGMPAAIRAAKQRLNDSIRVEPVAARRADGTMRQTHTKTIHMARDKLRIVYAASSVKPVPRRVSDIEEPESWTIVSLANYVEDLVDSAPDRSYRRSFYPPTNPTPNQPGHVDSVTIALLALFTKPTVRPYLSNYATGTALNYLAHHRRIPAIRRIIESIDTSTASNSTPYPFLTTRIFNTCMRATRDASDLHNYTFFLQLMLSRQCVPDWETWCSLLSLVYQRSPSDAKNIVLNLMRAKGLLADPQAKMEVAAIFVRADFADWVDRGGCTNTFIHHYDKLMDSKNWLEPKVANRMLAVRCERGHFSDALSILNILRARGRLPDEVSLNTLVENAAVQNNMTAVLEVMKDVIGNDIRRKIKIQERVYTHLFRMAKRRQDYNLLRIVWRYACLTGNVSYEMQSDFEKTIVWYAPQLSTSDSARSDAKYAESRSQVFSKFAYKAAVGVESGKIADSIFEHLDLKGKRIEFEEKIVDFALEAKTAAAVDPVSSASDSTSNSGPDASSTASAETTSPTAEIQEPPQSRKSFLRSLIRSDMAAATDFYPQYDFPCALEAAAKMDESWKLLGVRKTPDFKWIIENAITVPLYPKDRKEDARRRDEEDQSRKPSKILDILPERVGQTYSYQSAISDFELRTLKLH
ncbi:hypothetical protein BDV97DRAFT_395171 [Delphinella strobiligena]|nr:hypothetical protein BDV97DRAFT_395171 [Delphinella strobiligena]